MHPSNQITLENLNEVIFWHRPTAEAVTRMEDIAMECSILMRKILEKCPDCADRTKALQYVRAARMWANSSIALECNDIDHSRGVT